MPQWWHRIKWYTIFLLMFIFSPIPAVQPGLVQGSAVASMAEGVTYEVQSFNIVPRALLWFTVKALDQI